MSLWLNIRKHLIFSWSSSAETLLWQKQLIPAPFYLKSISLLLISHYFISQPFHHVCLLLAKKLASQKQAIAFDENFFGTFSALCLSFVFFVFVFWPIETTAVNLQGLGHWNPSKSTNQVTLSNDHINHFFWAQGNLVHYLTNPYFLLFIFWWRKEGCMIDSPATVAFTVWHSQK